jgi:hypothetical protein
LGFFVPVEFAGMESDDLTHEQLAKLYPAFWPHLNYVVRLDKRLKTLGFQEDERLRKKVIAARNAMQALHIHLHYLSCPDSTANRPRAK